MGRRTSGTAPTLSEVARHAGVSLATASRAINGSSTRVVGEELRGRVLESARILGYAPDANAQAMATGTTRAVGVVVHDLTDPYFAAIADGMSRAAADRHLFLTLATTGNRLDQLADVVGSLDSLRVRAMVLVGARWKDSDVKDALRVSVGRYLGRGGRVVAIGMDFPGVDCVRVDNAQGARDLADRLVSLGYRRPVVLTGPERHSTAAARSDAFAARMAELGHPVPDDHLISSDFTRTGGTVGMRLALEARLDADVVVAMNDVMALGAMNQARASGVRIPTELAFAGFGDIATLEDVVPGLTTVRVPMAELGALAVGLATDGPGDGSGSVTVPVSVVVRESTPRRT